MSTHFLSVESLKKVYPSANGTPNPPVFEDIHFHIDKGEFVCIIGHSGCGKTTILNVLAGLEEASAGNAFMDSREVKGPSLDRGVVFQSHALMPWMSVLGNVAFAVKSKWPDWSKDKIAAHASQYLEMVGLGHAIHKKPAELSGGMKQRVGIARAFAIQPKMLLLDEPFGALDALTRGTIQDELLKIVQATHQTVFMITHDVDEAILLADKIMLMSNGRTQDRRDRRDRRGDHAAQPHARRASTTTRSTTGSATTWWISSSIARRPTPARTPRPSTTRKARRWCGRDSTTEPAPVVALPTQQSAPALRQVVNH
jgi:nitrate/nitrite transport system ATP-binding protein